jgi:hypothetical protein
VKYREALVRLQRFGVREDPRRGKGSERLWIRETEPGSGKGPRATVKCHGEGNDIGTGALRAALRRLGIDPKDLFG